VLPFLSPRLDTLPPGLPSIIVSQKELHFRGPMTLLSARGMLSTLWHFSPFCPLALVSSVSRPGAHPCVLLVCWFGLLTVAQQRWDGRQYALAQQSQGSQAGSHSLHLHHETGEASTIKNTSLMLWGFKWNPRAPCKRPQYAPGCLGQTLSPQEQAVDRTSFSAAPDLSQKPNGIARAEDLHFPGFILIKQL
jgi:hypothetical protein